MYTENEIYEFLNSEKAKKIFTSDLEFYDDDIKLAVEVEDTEQFNTLKESRLGDFYIVHRDRGDERCTVSTYKYIESKDDFYNFIKNMLEDRGDCFYRDSEDGYKPGIYHKDELILDEEDKDFMGYFNYSIDTEDRAYYLIYSFDIEEDEDDEAEENIE